MTTSTKSLLALAFIASSISIIGSQDLYAGRNWHGENQQAAFAQSPQTTSIGITSPKDNSQLECVKIIDDQCFFRVTGQASALQKGEYISLMLRVPGGTEWWHSGNSIQYPSDFNKSEWRISTVSIDLKQKSDQVEAKAIVTDSSLPSGKVFSQLPPHRAESQVYSYSLPTGIQTPTPSPTPTPTPSPTPTSTTTSSVQPSSTPVTQVPGTIQVILKQPPKSIAEQIREWMTAIGTFFVPIIIGGGGYLLDKRVQKLREDEARELHLNEVKMRYLKDMTNLLAQYRLDQTKHDDSVAKAAQGLTIATLSQLDQRRKQEIIDYLYRMKLLDGTGPALLRDINLSHLDLRDIDFHNADLFKTDFEKTLLDNSDLSMTRVERTNFNRASLCGTDLHLLDLGKGVALYGAKYDKNTLFIEGFNPQEWGMEEVPVPRYLPPSENRRALKQSS